jgi:NADP-dependent 3-hydroxy acid dehydrogenase YdfG
VPYNQHCAGHSSLLDGLIDNLIEGRRPREILGVQQRCAEHGAQKEPHYSYHDIMPVNLEKQVVLVVGASSGIGRETAVQFAREGARVMAAARREDRLATLRKEVPSIETAIADAAKLEDMERLARETESRLGPIDILVYNTGTNIKQRALVNLTPALWDMMIAVNLNGAYYITQAVLPRMRERRTGHIVYVASISGIVPDVSGAAYQAAKRGIIGLAHAIRVEEREHGIRTCAVCPGLVDTEILENRPVKPPAETLAKALKAEDVAETIVCIAKLPARIAVPEIQVMPTVL